MATAATSSVRRHGNRWRYRHRRQLQQHTARLTLKLTRCFFSHWLYSSDGLRLFDNRTVNRTVTLHTFTVEIRLCVIVYSTANRPSSVSETSTCTKGQFSFLFSSDENNIDSCTLTLALQLSRLSVYTLIITVLLSSEFFLRSHDNSWIAALSLMKFCMNV